MYSHIFQGSVSLAIVADAFRVIDFMKYSKHILHVEQVIPQVLFVNSYVDEDGNRCYPH